MKQAQIRKSQEESCSNGELRVERAKRISGEFAAGSGDGSRLHDRHLADAFAEPAGNDSALGSLPYTSTDEQTISGRARPRH